MKTEYLPPVVVEVVMQKVSCEKRYNVRILYIIDGYMNMHK